MGSADRNRDGFRLNWLATPFIDLLTFFAYLYLMPLLVSRFTSPTVWNPVAVLAVYLLMCAGLFLGKRLAPRPAPESGNLENSVESDAKKQGGNDRESGDSRNLGCGMVLWLAWPYAAFVIVVLLETGGAFVTGSDLGARLGNLSQSGPLVLIPATIVFLLVLLLFPMVLLLKSRPRVTYGSPRHTLFRMISVLSVNAMMLVNAAYWEWQLVDAEPMEVALAGKILIFLLAYAVFLMFYAPPRLALLNLEPGRWTFLGYAVILANTVWRLMS